MTRLKNPSEPMLVTADDLHCLSVERGYKTDLCLTFKLQLLQDFRFVFKTFMVSWIFSRVADVKTLSSSVLYIIHKKTKVLFFKFDDQS